MDANALPQWKCHKVVRAAQIREIHHTETGARLSLQGIPDQDDPVEIDVDAAYMERNKPANGGYFVVYEDGYQSFSPAAAFEGGYALVPEAEKADPA